MIELRNLVTAIPTPFNMIVLVVLITSVAGVITAIVKQLGEFGRQRQELAFKRELLDRGMSIEEMQQVVSTRGKLSGKRAGQATGEPYFSGKA